MSIQMKKKILINDTEYFVSLLQINQSLTKQITVILLRTEKIIDELLELKGTTITLQYDNNKIEIFVNDIFFDNKDSYYIIQEDK